MKKNSFLQFMLLLLTSLTLLFGSVSVFAGENNNKDGFKHAPKNIIVMISDGCGYNHIKAANHVG